MTPDPAQSWLTAINNPEIAAALEDVYSTIAAEIRARGPACWASGRCCNFQKTGHRLYVTGLEAAYTVSRLTSPPLTSASLAAALASGGCPFQAANLCGVHAIRPLGCRVYFCDRSAQDWQMDLSERMLARVRAIHDAHAIDYRYGEWRQMLALFIPPGEAAAA